MQVTIQPGKLQGSVTILPSKSHAHRLLIASALAEGETRIHCPSENADIAATIRCLNALGAGITRQGEYLIVRGGMPMAGAGAALDCGESGSTLRFLIPLCGCMSREITLTGHGRLPSRPNGPLLSVMKENGAELEGEGLPLRIKGGMKSGCFALPGHISSQYFTGLLLALPLLSGESALEYTSPLESMPYVNMTLDTLRQFGIRIEEMENGWRIPGNQRYCSPGMARVEGDWSAAAFWVTANHLGSAIDLQGLNPFSPQGDKAIGQLLRRLGGKIDVTDTPDLMPILSVAAAAWPGETEICGAARLRIKESDRLAAMAGVIRALGGNALETPDGLIIRGGKLRGGVVDGMHDHRVVMSAAVAATVCEGPVTILGAEAADKSYPGFFRDFASLGGIADVR
ncbi:MAG: 3-phosphoshikimate 1-carboxyvinyltransferase [Clostridia bacterium]|nr:3-phosphoshikimate 1-carboxyvinyltransferase [Clostridia bacterium]